jgi:hypothetical protein
VEVVATVAFRTLSSCTIFIFLNGGTVKSSRKSSTASAEERVSLRRMGSWNHTNMKQCDRGTEPAFHVCLIQGTALHCNNTTSLLGCSTYTVDFTSHGTRVCVVHRSLFYADFNFKSWHSRLRRAPRLREDRFSCSETLSSHLRPWEQSSCTPFATACRPTAATQFEPCARQASEGAGREAN